MVDTKAPDPQLKGGSKEEPVPTVTPSKVTVTLIGCGGMGLNTMRRHVGNGSNSEVLYFDTSMTNSRPGETVHVIGDGSGSGSLRAQNARDIEREITALPDDQIGDTQVGIIAFSLSGGSGSVLGPIMAREFIRRNKRAVVVCVADTSSSISAKNTINTLKTLTAMANNNNLHIPMIVLSNDSAKDRRGADQAAEMLIGDLLQLLTEKVHEVDQSDRLNFLDPSKVIGSKPGLKLLQLVSERAPTDPTIVIGVDSKEMVDSLLILQNPDDETPGGGKLPLSRLKKMGFFHNKQPAVVGKVTGDITAIDAIVDSVQKVQDTDSSQRYGSVDRLSTSGSDDLIL